MPHRDCEAVTAAKRRAYALLQAGGSLGQVLSRLTSVVEQLATDGSVASILVLDRAGLLRNGASPSLPADYLDKIDRLRPHPDVGTCASAAATGKVVITVDFREDSKWAELKDLPLRIGFKSAWSMPIKAPDGRVLGTFGTYFRTCRRPTPAEVRVVSSLAGVAADAILVSLQAERATQRS